MNKRTILMAAALLGTTGLTVAAGQNAAANQAAAVKQELRQPDSRAHYRGEARRDLPRGFNNLNLSDAQKAKIKAIMEADRPAKSAAQTDREAFRRKMENRRTQENRLLSAKTFDEQAARALIAERRQEREALENEHAERELSRLKRHHAVFQVLTPAQQKQYLQNQEQMFQRRMQPQNGAPAAPGKR